MMEQGIGGQSPPSGDEQNNQRLKLLAAIFDGLERTLNTGLRILKEFVSGDHAVFARYFTVVTLFAGVAFLAPAVWQFDSSNAWPSTKQQYDLPGFIPAIVFLGLALVGFVSSSRSKKDSPSMDDQAQAKVTNKRVDGTPAAQKPMGSNENKVGVAAVDSDADERDKNLQGFVETHLGKARNAYYGFVVGTVGMDPFYRVLRKLQIAASGKILQVGSGFSCENDEAYNRAVDYLRVLTGCAIRNNGGYERIEMANPTMVEWFGMVGKYLACLENVDVWVPCNDNAQPVFIKDFCVLPFDKGEDWVEMMVPVFERDNVGDRRIEKVGDYFFIQSERLALSLRDTVGKLKKNNVLRRIDREELLKRGGLADRKPEDKRDIFYFAYGSNMDKDHLKKRIGEVDVPEFSKHELRKYKLAFNIKGTIFDGYVANIVYTGNPDDRVLGALYMIDSYQKELLDFFEGATKRGGKTEYDPVEIGIDGRSEKAVVYAKPYLKDPSGKPSEEYKKMLVKGGAGVGHDEYEGYLDTVIKELQPIAT